MNIQHDAWSGEVISQQYVNKDSTILKKLPALLRFLGAAALVIAMYSFLAKGWQSGNDVFRYLLMLGNTGVLAAIGLASGHWLKESKGARLLLTLALVSVPANFAILGAFIFSQTAAVDIGQYPHYVAWTVDNLNTALLTSAGAMLILIPVTLLGFTVLARSMSKKLSLLFICSNVALLLPLRDPQLIGLLVLVLTAFTIIFSRKAAYNHTAAKTQEGATALGLQLLPLAALMGRSLWLYSLDLFLMTVLSITVFFILRQISLYLKPDSRLRNTLDGLSLFPAISATLWFSVALLDAAILPEALALPLAALISAAMVYDISRRSHSSTDFYHNTAIAGLVLCMLANLTFHTGLLAAAACVFIGLGLLMYAFTCQQRRMFIGGSLLVMTGISQQLYELMYHFDLGSWASLAILGIAAILVASIMESQGGQFKPRLVSWKTKFQQWER